MTTAGQLRLPAAWFGLRQVEIQQQLWTTQGRFVGVAAGRGSGKTELSRRRIVRALAEKKPWPDPIYFYALPTFAQAKRVAWKPLKKLIPKEWLAKPPSESELTIETVFGSTLYVVGMDKPERIEGVQWDGCVIDESCDQKPGVFDRSVRPALTHRKAWCWRIGVPKRFGPGAREFKQFCETQADAYFHWGSEQILTEEELLAVKATTSESDFNEQYGADWLKPGGLMFDAFGEWNITDLFDYDPQREIVVGSDFNVTPMSWVLGHWRGKVLEVFDEIRLKNTNTRRTLEELRRRHPEHQSGWEFCGDASGRANKSSAEHSDLAQIRRSEFSPKKVRYLRANPRIVDRVSSTNARLKDANGEVHVRVHPRCKHLIRDLENRAWKQHERKPDDSDKESGHMSDALGYILYRHFPIKSATSSGGVITT